MESYPKTQRLIRQQILESLKSSPLEVREERASGAPRQLAETAPRAFLLPTAWRDDR